MKYRDEYDSIIHDFFFDRDKDKLYVPFVRPSEVFRVPSKRGKFETRYIRLNMSLDIETTKVGEFSAPYIMTISLNRPDEDIFYCYHFRNWDEVQLFMDEVALHYGVGLKFWDKNNKQYSEYTGFKKNRRVLLCFIHNASFEFAFCRSELKFANGKYDFFAKESRKMMKANLANGIELRDSLALTNCGLELLSKQFTKHKKIKDLDYSIPRNTKTPLSRNKEMRYINDDCIILNEFETYLFTNMCVPGKKIPLTNTARLLLKVEASAGFDIDKERERVRKIQPTAKEVIEASRHLFRGGFVHGNIRYLNSVERVLMRDITSSYPYAMLTKYFPVSKFTEYHLQYTSFQKGKESPEFWQLLNKYCLIIDATYYDVEATSDHSYESVSKVKDVFFEHPITDQDNGRIRRCQSVRVMQTELDYMIYQMMYDYSVMEIHSVKFAARGELPEYLLKNVASDYKKKNDLKKSGMKDTPEYSLAKIDVNTYFGALCKAIYENNIGYDYGIGDWNEIPQSIEAIQEDLDNRWLNFYWGVWTTAHARFKLVDMLFRIESVGGHVIYYDTDSLKYIPNAATEEIFEAENARIAKERASFPLLSDPAFWGSSGEGLGEWAKELETDDPVEFKTLGAKRYLYIEDGQSHLCVAGLPKTAAALLPEDPFETFSVQGFKFIGEDTDKLRPIYHDEPYDVTITDDYGNTETIHCKTGVTLVPIDFEISEKKLYNIIMQHKEYIKQRREYLTL